MGIFMVYDNLPEYNYKAALFLFNESELVQINQEGLLERVDQEKAKKHQEEHTGDKIPFLKFWILFSVASEYLIKAVFLKKGVNVLKKETGIQSFGRAFFQIKANDEPMKTFLQETGISNLAELNSYNLEGLLRSIPKLTAWSQDECNKLNGFIKLMRATRRNKVLHLYDKVNSISLLNDLNGNYIPAINLLITKFNE